MPDLSRLVALGLDLAEGVLVVATPSVWLVATLRLIGSEGGRAYLGRQPDRTAQAEAILGHPQSATMAGLVLAGLAIGSPFASAPDAAGGLIVALSAFVIAWVLGFVVGDRRALIASDAFTWTGAASLLGSVYLLSSAMTGIAGVARAALVLASAAVCFASWQIQAAHLEEGRLATSAQ